MAIFWTQFALDEAREGGYHGPACVIPLGVDLNTYKPLGKMEARRTWGAQTGFGETLGNPDNFIVGNVNRNQPRKRWDLTVKYFGKWIEDYNINNAWLYMHAAPTGDASIAIMDLARYYHCLDRTLYVEPPVHTGMTEDEVCKTYNCFDVLISTTQGEGFGLPAAEAMACGVPCILPDWSAFGEWAKDAAELVPCTSTRIDFPYQNVIGGVADEAEFIDALDRLYRNRIELMRLGEAGLKRINEDRFRWPHIGTEYLKVLDDATSRPAPEAKVEALA
jgi:glycosyltransferase involved in cell wall biosynthesis